MEVFLDFYEVEVTTGNNIAQVVQDDTNNDVRFRTRRKMHHSAQKMSKMFSDLPCARCEFGYPLQNARFLLLSTYLAREWLQIDTDSLLIITSTAGKLSGGTNIDDLKRP